MKIKPHRRALMCLGALCFHLLATAQPSICSSGLDATEKGRNEEAIPLLTSCLALQLPPRVRSAALQARAVSLLEAKRAEEALFDQLEAFTLVPPTSSVALANLSAIQRALGRFDEALATLKKAQTIDDGPPGSGPGMAVWYHTGLTYMAMKRYMNAVTAFTTGIPKQPGYAAAYYQRGLAYEALGAMEQAVRDFQQAASLSSPEGEFPPEYLEKLKAHGITMLGPKQ